MHFSQIIKSKALIVYSVCLNSKKLKLELEMNEGFHRKYTKYLFTLSAYHISYRHHNVYKKTF